MIEQQSGVKTEPVVDPHDFDAGDGVQEWRWTHAVFWGAFALSILAGVVIAVLVCFGVI